MLPQKGIKEGGFIMTKVKIEPGICGLITHVEAETDDDCMEVTVRIDSKCKAVQKMFEDLGTEFDAFDVCLGKPGQNVFYQYAADHFPGHASCPTIAGITKCIEVECKLALPKTAKITFEE